MNALTLTILLHYYWAIDEYKTNTDLVGSLHGDFSPAEMDALDFLHTRGLLEWVQSSTTRKITLRGRTHIDALLAAPLPVQHWVSPLSDLKEK